LNNWVYYLDGGGLINYAVIVSLVYCILTHVIIIIYNISITTISRL